MSVVRMTVAGLILMLVASPLAAQGTRAQRPMMRDSLMPCPSTPASGGAMAGGQMAGGNMSRDTAMARGGMMRPAADSMRPPCRPNTARPN